MRALLVNFSLVLLMASPVLAAPAFTPVRDLGSGERARLTPALDATFHFRLDPGVDCVGTYISHSGHFITARHCVNDCLFKHKVVERELALTDPTAEIRLGQRRDGTPLVRPAYTYKMTVAEDRVSEGLRCPGFLGEHAADFEVVFTGGRGWLAPSETLASFSQKYPEDYEELLAAGYEHAGDFAVLVAHASGRNVASSGGSRCLALSRLGALRGQPVQAVSYPCMHRGSLRVSGSTPLYTSGVKTAGFKESAYFRRLGEDHVPFRVASVERKETFFSTLDMERCGSGTAVLGPDFSIVGIATRVYKSGYDYESGSLEAVDSAEILHELRERAPGAWREMTDCR